LEPAYQHEETNVSRLQETGGNLADIRVALWLHGSQKIKGITPIYDHGFQIFEKKFNQKPMKLPVLSQNQTSGSLGLGF